MVIVWGYRTGIGRRIGATALLCRRCQRVRAFYFHELLKRHHIYYITYRSERLPDVLVCGFCQSWLSVTGFDPRYYPPCDQYWTPAYGLQSLVDRTNPQLGQVVEGGPPTQSDVRSLFSTSEERSSLENSHINGAIIVGALIGTVLSIMVMPHGASLGIDIFLGALGAIAGGFAMGYVRYKMVSNKAARKVLKNAIEWNDLSPDALRNLGRGLSRQFPRTWKVLNRIGPVQAAARAMVPRSSDTPQPRSDRSICPSCGLANFASAVACRRCAAAFGGATVAARVTNPSAGIAN